MKFFCVHKTDKYLMLGVVFCNPLIRLTLLSFWLNIGQIMFLINPKRWSATIIFGAVKRVRHTKRLRTTDIDYMW